LLFDFTPPQKLTLIFFPSHDGMKTKQTAWAMALVLSFNGRGDKTADQSCYAGMQPFVFWLVVGCLMVR
jgi:hypothetical protein